MTGMSRWPRFAIACSASAHADRKSTRLNSSHGYISYAVFCLKKKKTCTAQCRESQSTARFSTPPTPQYREPASLPFGFPRPDHTSEGLRPQLTDVPKLKTRYA